MSIKIQVFKRVFVFDFGYNTHWFSNMYFFTIIEEFYDGMEVCYAKMIFYTN